jgi:threonine/homoserine/homoserine lactone efflux protein
MHNIFNDIITAYPFGFFLSLMIGPVFFVLIETSISKGFRAAVSFNTGVVVADVVFILIAYLSSYQLIESIKEKPALLFLVGFLMFTYGLVSFFRLKKQKIALEQEEEVILTLNKKDYLGLFIKGFFLNFINIGVLGFWLAIIITIGPKLNMETNRIIIFFASVIIFYFLIDLLKIFLAKQLKSKLTTHNIILVKKLISVVLIVFGLILMIQGWFPNEKKMIQEKIEDIRK